jgi:hypothetical protein
METFTFTVEVRELLDGRLVVVHEDVIRGETPSPGPAFILTPREQRHGAARSNAHTHRARGRRVRVRSTREWGGSP